MFMQAEAALLGLRQSSLVAGGAKAQILNRTIQ
jgi:hypothetical protein